VRPAWFHALEVTIMLAVKREPSGARADLQEVAIDRASWLIIACVSNAISIALALAIVSAILLTRR
jgi:hypothetical protein